MQAYRQHQLGHMDIGPDVFLVRRRIHDDITDAAIMEAEITSETGITRCRTQISPGIPKLIDHPAGQGCKSIHCESLNKNNHHDYIGIE